VWDGNLETKIWSLNLKATHQVCPELHCSKNLGGHLSQFWWEEGSTLHPTLNQAPLLLPHTQPRLEKVATALYWSLWPHSSHPFINLEIYSRLHFSPQPISDFTIAQMLIQLVIHIGRQTSFTMWIHHFYTSNPHWTNTSQKSAYIPTNQK
jgi:hypothetical protein